MRQSDDHCSTVREALLTAHWPPHINSEGNPSTLIVLCQFLRTNYLMVLRWTLYLQQRINALSYLHFYHANEQVVASDFGQGVKGPIIGCAFIFAVNSFKRDIRLCIVISQ